MLPTNISIHNDDELRSSFKDAKDTGSTITKTWNKTQIFYKTQTFYKTSESRKIENNAT